MSPEQPRRRIVPFRRRVDRDDLRLPPFADLLWENFDALYRTARHLAGEANADDVVQEAGIRAFKGYAAVRDGKKARAWLFAVLRRVALDHRDAAPAGFVDVDVESVLVDATRDPEFEDRLLARDALARALEELEPMFREVVWLIDVEGFSVQEVAEIIESPVGTVASRLYRGRRRIRLGLEEGADDA